MKSIETLLGRRFGFLPPEVVRWMNDTRAKILAADPDDPVLERASGELNLLQRQHGQGSLGEFLGIHDMFHPDSIALLEVDNSILRDLLWSGALTVPDVEEKIASGEISPRTLRPDRFEKLQQELRTWHTIEALGWSTS